MVDMIIDKSSPIPQYFQLQTWLIEQIEQGVFKPDDKIPTEAEMQHMTGLARATIRQAIQNLANMGYLERRRRLGTFVLNRVKSDKKQTIIGVLVPDIRTGYSPELARGAGDEAAKNHHSIILCNTDDLYVKASILVKQLIDTGVSGIIFVPTASPDEKNLELIEKFRRTDIPVVLADRLIPGLDIDSVTTDNFDGAYTLTRHLIDKGHERIGITLSTLFSTERERLAGYREALSDVGLTVDPDLIVTSNGPFSEDSYKEYARSLLKKHKKMSAIFAGHDRIAFVITAMANKMRIKIPENISIAGYDDLPFTNTHPLGLTTMHQPIYEIGQESMNLILSRIRGKKSSPKKIILHSYLVERDSVASILK
jgi:DNA-binding LacI/PurR family transcriptional regulator